jgi:hypothetical protein
MRTTHSSRAETRPLETPWNILAAGYPMLSGTTATWWNSYGNLMTANR